MFKERRSFFRRQWLFIRAFSVLFALLLVGAAVVEVLGVAREDEPPEGELLIMLAVMLAGCLGMAWLARHWFNFLAGEEICQWRYDK